MTDFPLEKILTISAFEYAGYQDDDLRISDKFEMQGVHYTNFYDHDQLRQNTPIKEFAETIPRGTEVVVGYRLTIVQTPSNTNYPVIQSGVALIPKTKSDKNYK